MALTKRDVKIFKRHNEIRKKLLNKKRDNILDC